MIEFGTAVAQFGLVVIIVGFAIDLLSGLRMPDMFEKSVVIAALTLWIAGVLIAIIGSSVL